MVVLQLGVAVGVEVGLGVGQETFLLLDRLPTSWLPIIATSRMDMCS